MDLSWTDDGDLLVSIGQYGVVEFAGEQGNTFVGRFSPQTGSTRWLQNLRLVRFDEYLSMEAGPEDTVWVSTGSGITIFNGDGTLRAGVPLR